MTWRGTRWGGAALLLLALVLAVAAPLVIVLGVARLAGFVLLTAGAAVLVGRAGAVDLAPGAVAGVGGYAGGVVVGLLGWPGIVGPVFGAVTGGLLGGINAAVLGRVGRTLGALTSLALGAATVALLRAWPGAGGAAGFHAVPLLTGSDRGDLAVLLVLVALALLTVDRHARSEGAAAAAVAVAAPHVSTSHGRSPVADSARAGLVGGTVLGAGGAAVAAVTGSVVPAAFGLPLSAALVLAALVGGAAPWGPVLGAALVWGPSLLWPLAPLIGDAPPLLTTGVLALGLVAVRRARPLVAWSGPEPTTAAPSAAPQATLRVIGARLPDGGTVSLEVGPGEVVALVGPNGSGKSTLLAQVGGQLPTPGETRLGGALLGRGARRRARAGIARTWQRPPDVPMADAERVARVASSPLSAGVADALGPDRDTPAGSQLLRAAADPPAVVLLDEPAATLPAERVIAVLGILTSAGVGVLLAEHRPEVVAVADRVVHVWGSDR